MTLKLRKYNDVRGWSKLAQNQYYRKDDIVVEYHIWS